jgi:hypothetical protein
MGRETVDAKATRYLDERRLTVMDIKRAGDALEAAYARCQGTAEQPYDVEYDGNRRGFYCSCPAWRRCCHVTAFERVLGIGER